MENNKFQDRIVALKAKIYKEASSMKDGLLNTIDPNVFLSPVVDMINALNKIYNSLDNGTKISKLDLQLIEEYEKIFRDSKN
jgi:hypothetical protein